MTKEQHIERHKKLHAALDELIGDWIAHSKFTEPTRLPSKHTVLELMKWSAQQTLKPDEFDRR